VALDQMRKGEGGMAAVVFIDAFVRGRFEKGFKFLAVAYNRKLEDRRGAGKSSPMHHTSLADQ
jgi:hypothetical protein